MTKKESEKKINFGGYAIIEGAKYSFEKMPDLWWEIKPITSGMELARSKFLYHNRVVEGLDGARYEQPPSPMEIAYREIALTFGGTSMEFDASASTDPDGDDLQYRWWIYPEAGKRPYGKELPIPNATEANIQFTIPADAAGKELHLILEVWDESTIISLVDYRRAVIQI